MARQSDAQGISPALNMQYEGLTKPRVERLRLGIYVDIAIFLDERLERGSESPSRRRCALSRQRQRDSISQTLDCLE